MAEPCWDQLVDDGDFRCAVIQDPDDGYRGTLTITVVDSGEVIHTQPVGVGYAARFGADVDDIAQWQMISLDIIDGWLDDHQ